jgi:hypothetical protein
MAPVPLSATDPALRVHQAGGEVIGFGTASLFSKGRPAATWSPPCPPCTRPW